MAGRIRTIKPELLEDEVAAGLSDAAWRLFVSSWILADDYGCFRAGTKYLAAQVWQDTSADAEGPLRELAKAGRVLVYDIDGQRYASLPNWDKHQRVDNAGKRRVPAPPENIREVSRRFAENSANLREASTSPKVSPLDHDLRPTTNDLDRGPVHAAGAACPPSAQPGFELVSQEPPPAKPPKAEKPKRKPTRCPTSTDDSARSFIDEWGIPNFDGPNGAEVAKMLDHHGAKGSTFLDWRAVWRTWDTNADAFGKRTHGPARVAAKPRPPPTREPPRPTAAPPPIEQNLGMARDALRKLGGA